MIKQGFKDAYKTALNDNDFDAAHAILQLINGINTRNGRTFRCLNMRVDAEARADIYLRDETISGYGYSLGLIMYSPLTEMDD